MTKKIMRLSEEDIAALPAWRDKYIAAGLSTEPVDRKRAEQAACASVNMCPRDIEGLRTDSK